MKITHSMGDGLPLYKAEFCRFCRLLYDRHLVSGVGGNMAARAGDNVLLTPSGFSLRDVDPPCVALVNLKGQVMEGPQPTKDANMHLDILEARPDVHVVFHVHGAYITAATTLLSPGANSLPPLTPGFVHYAYPLAMIHFMVPGAKILAKSVAAQLAKKESRAVLLQNHGLVAIGKDFKEALNIVEEIDEAARIFVLTQGEASHIPFNDLSRI